jgi:hypothetical protein
LILVKTAATEKPPPSVVDGGSFCWVIGISLMLEEAASVIENLRAEYD